MCVCAQCVCVFVCLGSTEYVTVWLRVSSHDSFFCLDPSDYFTVFIHVFSFSFICLCVCVCFTKQIQLYTFKIRWRPGKNNYSMNKNRRGQFQHTNWHPQPNLAEPNIRKTMWNWEIRHNRAMQLPCFHRMWCWRRSLMARSRSSACFRCGPCVKWDQWPTSWRPTTHCWLDSACSTLSSRELSSPPTEFTVGDFFVVVNVYLCDLHCPVQNLIEIWVHVSVDG